MVRGVPGAIGHRKFYGKELKFRLVTDNAANATMYEALNPEIWFSSH